MKIIFQNNNPFYTNIPNDTDFPQKIMFSYNSQRYKAD